MDSIQIQYLPPIQWESRGGVSFAWARNILIASDLLEYQEPIVNESTLKSSRKDKFHWTNSRSIKSSLKVFPNPAREFIIVEYRKNNILDQIQIEFLDSKGIKVRSYILSKSENQQLLPTGDLPSGTYLIQLYVNGIPAESCRLVIIR
jgi:hypothetical protein